MSKAKVPIGTIYSANFTFDKLTKKYYEENPKAFEFYKISGWLDFLQKEEIYPYHWNNPSRNGLVAKCKPIESQEQYKIKMNELKQYIDYVNKEYKTDIKIEKDEDNQT